MSEALTLDKLIAVSPRFTRSVAIVSDFERSDTLDGYILTPVGRDVLGRVSGGLRGRSSTRAWSLTGPYGSGKSAFALFVAQLLAGDPKARDRARSLLRDQAPQLADALFASGSPLYRKGARFCPVLVCGSQRPLEQALADALAHALRRLVPRRGRRPGIIPKLEAASRATDAAGSSVIGLFEEAAAFLRRGAHADGLVLIIDELGKFLEFGASHPDRGDVFILQELAEAATRSSWPFLVLTILHQAMDRYADHVSPSQRSEWAKIQGRFEDVAFEERSEHLLRLLTHAFRPKGPEHARTALASRARMLAAEAIKSGVRLGPVGGTALQRQFEACYPLHPLTALTVGPLFRQLAQNERSLFAFLTSSEPSGFQDFLRATRNNEDCPAYRLDHLYDYVIIALGPTLFAQHRGKAWAEVEAALERLRDAPELEIRIAKTIGLLQALGPTTAVVPSREMVQLALRGLASPKEIQAALASLERKSIAIFRRHQGGFALWEGSDIDIEARLDAARREVSRDQPIAGFLMRFVPPRPMIARRHYFQKGTLRYFETRYAGVSNLHDELTKEPSPADGRIVLCLPANAEERKSMQQVLQSIGSKVPAQVVAAIPHDLLDLHAFCHEVACLHWVRDHTPELESDRIALRELHSRLTHAEQGVRRLLDWIFTPQAGQATAGCTWYQRGRDERLSSILEVNQFLSRVCDEVYPATPTWRNELINRRSLSSAAAAARRNLIEAMIERPTDEALGFIGVPPERCMYETLLRGSGLHRVESGTWGFRPPRSSSEPALQELWAAIDRFLSETEPAKRSIVQLFTVLRRPPFGLKDGVLPVLLAAALLHYDTEIALYEEGTFVPRLSAAIFERMFRSPERFEIQRFRIAGPRYDVYRSYAQLLQKAAGVTEAKAPNLLTVVKPLMRLVRDLPDHVVKTQQVSATSRAVLRAIREARQPDLLLFSQLPRACGFDDFEPEGEFDAAQAARYFETLRAALTELQRAYPHLIATIERLVLHAFEFEGPLSEARRQLDHQARLVLNLAVDPKLKAFLHKAKDAESEDTYWLESIANLLVGTPPSVWDDQDMTRFEVQLAATARSFHQFRVLAFEMQRTGTTLLDGDPGMLRVSVTLPDAGEYARVVTIPEHLRRQTHRIQSAVRQVLDDEKILTNRDASVAVLAELVRQLLAEPEQSHSRRSGRAT